jgi:hypothetical protein
MSTPSRLAKAGLARALGVERHRMTAILARAGAPSADRSRRYDVEEVAKFVAQHVEGGVDALRRARLRLVLLQCEKAQRDLDSDAGKVVSVAEVESWFEHVAARTHAAMRINIEEQAAPKVCGQDVVTCRLLLREATDRVCNSMAALGRDFFKDYEQSKTEQSRSHVTVVEADGNPPRIRAADEG